MCQGRRRDKNTNLAMKHFRVLKVLDNHGKIINRYLSGNISNYELEKKVWQISILM